MSFIVYNKNVEEMIWRQLTYDDSSTFTRKVGEA